MVKCEILEGQIQNLRRANLQPQVSKCGSLEGQTWNLIKGKSDTTDYQIWKLRRANVDPQVGKAGEGCLME